MSVKPNPIDLTTLAQVQQRLGMTGDADDQELADCITACSAYFQWAVGAWPQNGDWPVDSPLNGTMSQTETYDGNGAMRMFLRIRPIQSLQSVTVWGITIPISTGPTVPGVVVDGTGKSIAIRSGAGQPASGLLRVGFQNLGGRCGWTFDEGIQNVVVQYTAGFSLEPIDIEGAVRVMVAVNYKRKGWIDQKMQMMAGGAGSISFRDWEFPPEVKSVVEHYRRRALA